MSEQRRREQMRQLNELHVLWSIEHESTPLPHRPDSGDVEVWHIDMASPQPAEDQFQQIARQIFP